MEQGSSGAGFKWSRGQVEQGSGVTRSEADANRVAAGQFGQACVSVLVNIVDFVNIALLVPQKFCHLFCELCHLDSSLSQAFRPVLEGNML